MKPSRMCRFWSIIGQILLRLITVINHRKDYAMKNIIEFVKDEEIIFYSYLKEAEIKVTRTGKPFADMTFMDKTGTINAKKWDYEEDKPPEVGVYKIKAKVSEYNGTKQLTIDRIRPVNGDDSVSIDDFIRTAPEDAVMMFNEIESMVKAFKDDDLRKLVLALLYEERDKLMYWPAAKSMHHAYKTGLLYHIVRMLRMAKHTAEVYPSLNYELLSAMIILHDLAKIIEQDSNELGVVNDYSKEGILLGHLVIGAFKIRSTAESLGIDPELSLILQHAVIAHHGKPEYGSPISPLIPEVVALHHIDNIDAKLNAIDDVMETLQPGEFSNNIFALDRRRMYKSFYG